MLHGVTLTGSLEGVGCEESSAVGQQVGDPEAKGTERIRQESDVGRCRLFVFDSEVYEARSAVDGDLKVALAGDAVSIT